MGKIEFDAAAADAVVRAATSGKDELRAQSGARRSAVEEAAADFSGAYADRFTESASTESTDRGKLASVLDDLVGQVRDAKSSAQAEEERLNALDAWNEAERERQHAAATSLLATTTLPPVAIRAPKPSEVAVRPPSIHAAFAPRERRRSGGGTGHGRSSADPARLRDFSIVSRANDAAAESKASTLASAWTAFTASCSWVLIEGCTFVTGFDRFLEENRADAAWIDRIADAFEQAGSSGSLANARIDKATDDELVRDVQRLFADDLTPTQVAAMWADLGLTRADAADLALLPTSVLTALGNLEGAPYWARGAATSLYSTAGSPPRRSSWTTLAARTASTARRRARTPKTFPHSNRSRHHSTPTAARASEASRYSAQTIRPWLRCPSEISTKPRTSPGRCRGWDRARAA
ncbi:hypothetical protein [Curtobacterium sp. VKM Ac-1376]|uniref:hypothetical protein n=1 Tax=Curtobacterium sp. VKM Ac-1376 TaxID=123312 RepID=UPI001E40DEB7|nr:hypothetical protein [Curtobacterium sp. VKM Ac-1376]